MPRFDPSRVGTALLDAAYDVMTRRGMTQMQLRFGPQNLDGKRFYERREFHSISGRDTLTKALASSGTVATLPPHNPISCPILEK